MPSTSPVRNYGTLDTSFEERELYHDLLRCDAMEPSSTTFERFFREPTSTDCTSSQSNSHHDTFDNLSEQERCPIASSGDLSSRSRTVSSAYDQEKSSISKTTPCTFLTGILAFLGACTILSLTVSLILFSAVGLIAHGLPHELITLMLPSVFGVSAGICLFCAFALIQFYRDGSTFRTAFWTAFWGVEKFLLAVGFLLVGLLGVMAFMDEVGERG